MATATVTVALDAATGAVRWSREGMDTFCDTDVTGQDDVDTDPLLACQWQSGQMTVDMAAGYAVTYDKPAMALAAVDVGTGQARWTAAIGEVALDKQHMTPTPAVVPGAVVLDRVAGAVRVSLQDGALSAPDPNAVAWRTARVEFPQKVPWKSGLSPVDYNRHGEVFEGVLNAAVTDTVTVPLPASVGARFEGGLVVLTTAKGVAAYRT
jgi:outer membrane protein assembly factor BamB